MYAFRNFTLVIFQCVNSVGFWWGLNIGLIVAALCFLFIVFKTDFYQEVERVSNRPQISLFHLNRLNFFLHFSEYFYCLENRIT